MGWRHYDPELGRFIQPDTVVPDHGNPIGLDRYAYVAFNPVKFVDLSGNCWGIASGITGIPSYSTTCNNLNMALTIVKSSEASVGDKVAAGAYIAAESVAHAGLVIGVAGVACGLVGACAAAVEGALGIGTSACADGDCTNEASTAAKTAESVLDKLTRYVLNKDHPVGGTKATWFEKALGFTKDNVQALAEQIVYNPETATYRGTNEWGTLYNQTISVVGENGKVIDVIAAWIILEDGTIKLVNLLPPY